MAEKKAFCMIWNKRYCPHCLLLYLMLLIWQVEGRLQYQYVGCFYNSSESAPYSDHGQTIEKCIMRCQRQSNSIYAALKNGTTCHCIDDYGVQLPDDECNIPCPGNQSEYCEGETKDNKESSVYSASNVYTVCPVGNYGSVCDNVCHCKQQFPCDRMTGSCPNGCDGNYSGSSCNTILLSYQYIGCYKDDNNNRAMGNAMYSSHRNTLDSCTTTCRNKKFSYAGAQFGGECFCGDSYDKHGEWKEPRCNTTCNGNKNEICGGPNANSVFSVCPVGLYGEGCREKCNCLNNIRCIYRNGSCSSSQCKPGWTGNSCNIRDCTANNGDCNENETCSTVSLKFSKVSVCRCSKGFHRLKLWQNCTEMPESDISTAGSTLGAVLGSILCLAVLFAIFMVLCLYRRKLMNNSILQRIFSHQQSTIAATEISSLAFRMDTRKEPDIYSSSSPSSRNTNVHQLPDAIRSKISTPGVLDKEFKMVPMETKEPCNVGRNPDLKKKNRFKNIIPYDHNRVILLDRGNKLADYINASYIKGYNPSDKFIATQGPRTETVGDFWRMVCEKEVGVIVMITDLVENRKVKCEKYWPNVGESAVFDGIAVTTAKEEFWNDFASRQFQVTKNSQTLTVKQWHFLSWPDHGVPRDTNNFLNFHRKVRNSMKADVYTIVHCSAGVGRTGCFIAIDILLEQGNAKGIVDVADVLRSLREQRAQMVQTLVQYQFIHMVLLAKYSIGESTIPKDIFRQKLEELQQKDPENGRSMLDVQFQRLKETKEQLAGINNEPVKISSINRNKTTKMDAAFVQGWKKKNAYITLQFPTVVEEFYALCNENNCQAIIFIDAEQAAGFPLFPTKETQVLLRFHKVACNRLSETDYGTCYTLLQSKQSDETYENLKNLAIYANTGGETDRREMQVFHVTESLKKDAIDSHSLISLYKDIRRQKRDYPTVVFSKIGYSLTAFCLAAFNAFDMINDEKEVDVYQTALDIRKYRAQYEFSLSAYEELYAVIGQYIDQEF